MTSKLHTNCFGLFSKPFGPQKCLLLPHKSMGDRKLLFPFLIDTNIHWLSDVLGLVVKSDFKINLDILKQQKLRDYCVCLSHLYMNKIFIYQKKKKKKENNNEN